MTRVITKVTSTPVTVYPFFLLSSFLSLDIAMKCFFLLEKFKRNKKKRKEEKRRKKKMKKKPIWEFPQMSISFMFCLKFFSAWYAAQF